MLKVLLLVAPGAQKRLQRLLRITLCLFGLDKLYKRFELWFRCVACMSAKPARQHLRINRNMTLSDVVITAPACFITSSAVGISSLLTDETASARTKTRMSEARKSRVDCRTQM